MDIYDIEPTPIPKEFWSLQGITFEISAAQDESANYCHIDVLMPDLLAVFPGERKEIVGVERITIDDPCQKKFCADLLKLFPGFQILSASPCRACAPCIDIS
jgi:hypothetical protein